MQIRNKGVCRSFIDFIPYSMKNMPSDIHCGSSVFLLYEYIRLLRACSLAIYPLAAVNLDVITRLIL